MPCNPLRYFSRRHDDLDDEMRAHLAMAIADRIARGETPADADANARREFGNQALIKQTTRDVWRWTAVEHAARNLHYAWRRMKRDRGFSAIAILSLAFGLGAITPMFSIVDGVLLKPLQYRNSATLYVARTTPPPNANVTGDFPVNARHAHEWRTRCQSCEDVALVRFEELTLAGAGEPVRLATFGITSNFFQTLGVHPAIGRDFVSVEELRRGQVILSDTLWRGRFGADRTIVGRDIQLNGEPHTVVGVMPADLHLPKGEEWGTIFGPNEPALLFVPLGLDVRRAPVKGAYNFSSVIRLKPNVSARTAADELNSISAGLLQPLSLDNRTFLTPLTDQITRHVRSALWLLLAAVGTVLLIVCLNIGNLMLVRTAGRSREAGVRIALGASGGQLLSLVLMEALLVATIASGLGWAMTLFALNVFVRYASAALPRAAEVQADWRVLSFCVLASALSAGACCLAPAWKLTRTQPLESLKSASGFTTESSRRVSLREWIVGFEIALSTVLLMAAGVLAASFFRVMSSDKGFHVAHVITQDVSFLSPRYARGVRRQTVEDIIAKFAAIPGVTSVGAVNQLPLIGEDWVGNLADADEPQAEESSLATVNFRFVTLNYFRAMGIALKHGRLLTNGDKDQLRAVISEKAADHLWPGQDPIGKHVRGSGGRTQPALEIVGVVAEVPAGSADQPPTFTLYEHYWRMQPVGMSFALRTLSNPAAVASAAGKLLSAADPEMAIQPAVTMEQILDKSVAVRRLQTWLATAFAIAALLVALLGIYGVICFAVARRTAEIGIRVALGARPAKLIGLVLRQGMRPVAVGLAIGLPLGLAVNQLITSHLYQVAPDEPAVVVAVVVLMVIVAAGACCVPASRATRIDPVLALRFD